ncbi:hypothetical protein [Pseudoalteromonas phage SL25]|nr:hypothetical protein [Pseudoalteromonas phage SL25]
MICEEYECANGGTVTIEKVISGKKVLVSFSGDNSNSTYERDPYKVRNGKVKNKFKPSVYGVGFVGEGSFCTGCESYNTWKGIIKRCYCESSTTYGIYGGAGVKVCDSWLNYQNFAAWYDENKLSDSCCYNVDKDLLGGFEYSERTCALIPSDINRILNKQKSKRGVMPIGVFHSSSTKNPYTAIISLSGKARNLGVFKTEKDAFIAYKEAKEGLVKAESLKAFSMGFISERTKTILDNFEVNIND